MTGRIDRARPSRAVARHEAVAAAWTDDSAAAGVAVPRVIRTSLRGRSTASPVAVADLASGDTSGAQPPGGAPAAVLRASDLYWAEAIRTFKRDLLERTLERTHGNRTHAARALGLQRTYLLRLIHELGAQAPPAGPGGRYAPTPSPGTR
jgi:DNA-binding NtrC family response regulator